MNGVEFNELLAFCRVAEAGSFTRAAEVQGVSASAISQSLKNLERRVGVQLLNRTTRRLSLTEAGRQLKARVTSAIAELAAAHRELDAVRETPAGVVRILCPRMAYVDHLQALIPRFLAAHPLVRLDVTLSDRLDDIVADGHDIGIHLGEHLREEVVAVQVGPPLRQIAVASPAYLAGRTLPAHPRDLLEHACIGWRQDGSATPYAWEFSRDGEQLAISVKGPLVVSDRAMALEAALDGVGIAMWTEHRLREAVASGRLMPLLEDWSPLYPGFYAYYHRHRFMSSAVRRLLDWLRQSAGDAAPG